MKNTNQAALQFHLGKLTDEAMVVLLVRELLAAGLVHVDAGKGCFGGKAFGRGLKEAGLLGQLRISIDLDPQADYSSHSGTVRAVERALNENGLRRVDRVVLPWALGFWDGELGRTLESLREVSLFRQIVMTAPDIAGATRVLEISGIDAVRIVETSGPLSELFAAAGRLGKCVELVGLSESRGFSLHADTLLAHLKDDGAEGLGGLLLSSKSLVEITWMEMPFLRMVYTVLPAGASL